MKKKLTIALMMVTGLMACTSEEDGEQRLSNDGTLRFAPQMVSDWNAPWTTRAEAENSTMVQALQGSDGLYLQTSVQRGILRNSKVTRGTKYEGVAVPGETYRTFATDGSETFRVSGYRYADGSSVSSVTSANFMDNTQIIYDGDWRATGLNYVMPAATDLIDFFGWFVTDEATAGVTAVNAAGGLQLTYDMPTTIANQPDLLAAVTRSQTYSLAASALVPLQFNHQLTAVSFVLDENVAPGTITEIAFMNVYTKGTLAFDVQNGTAGTWTLINAPEATAYEVDFPTVVNSDLRDGETILGGLMMIPQEFTGEEQQIRIKMIIDGTPRNLFANLQGTEWEAGTTVTYKISTSAVNVLRISSVTYPTSWSAASTENSDIKSAYANGDEIGVFGVDSLGHVTFANKKYTWNGTNWVAEEGVKSLYVPKGTFYAYYPYQATLSGAPVESSETTILVNNALPTAAQFFSSVITNWTPAENQSTAALLNAQDLQIGKSTTGAVSTVSFPTMVHAMGLTSLALEKEISETRYFKVDNNGAETAEYLNSDDSITFSVSDNFEMKERMLADGQTYYYVVNPEATTVVVNGPTTGNNPWEAATINLEAPVGTYKKYCAITRNYKYHGNAYYYRGKGQQILVPAAGEYYIECWGASGGNATVDHSCGGYVAGKVTLTANQTLYVYVGQQGFNYSSSSTSYYSSSLMFNGGGTVSKSNNHAWGSGGGGATDIRTSYSSSWNNSTSLNSRIIIAAGGGGGGHGFEGSACAGGLTGYNGLPGWDSSNQTYWNQCQGKGASQTAGGSAPTKYSGAQSTGGAGGFGYGGNGGASASTADVGGGSGGGGGLYGGSGGSGLANGVWLGGGGSSYISGHSGCTAKSITFTSTVMIDGAGYNWTSSKESNNRILQPAPEGGDRQHGQIGNGFCRIKTPVID